MLSFTLLGQVSLYKNGTPLSRFRSPKEAALLIYLAQTGQSHQRDFMADLLWDGRSTQQALSNLRTVLTRLRKQVGETLIVAPKSLALAPESRQQVDSVLLLDTLAGFRKVDSAEKAGILQETLDTYHGDFLADFYLPDAPRFDAWVTATRDHIRRQVIAAYEKLGQYALSTGDVEHGIAIARRWLQVHALDETAHMLLIQLLVEDGHAREAVAHYNDCADLLRTELGIEPPAEMTALIRDVRPTLDVVKRPSAVIRHNLSASYDQFFGRESAQQDIYARLDQPWCRLVTIVGQGGVGKTRLATTVARSRLSHYRDGVWLVELADIDPGDADLAEAIAVEIATVLDLRLSGSGNLVEKLLTYLQHKQMLLVLDNFEHLLEGGVQLVLDLLQHCEDVQLLVTSRERLRTRAEWVIALTGLGYPSDDRDEMPSDAVDLFAARRAQQQPGPISAAELTAMGQICRMAEGLPLAIELAAALTHLATCREIADELRTGFDALTTSLCDVPQRHHSLRIVFERSWRTLTPALQQRLAQLSVFHADFTATAAQQIAGADAQQLAALADKSLLSYDAAADRYTLHAVVRAYAAAKRAEKCPATDQTLQKHVHYYLTLLAQHSEALQKNRPQQSMVVIQPDMANVRLAWQTGLAERNLDLLSAALTSLSIYYQLRGLAHEAEAIMHTTLRTAKTWGSDGIALATHAGLERARFQIRLSRYQPAIQTIKTALHNAQLDTDRWAEGMGHGLWGQALWGLGEYALAQDKLTHALNIAHALDATLLIGRCHHHLGVINDIQSRYAAALDHLQQACAAWRKIDNAQALSGSLNNIGLVRYHQGDLPAAQQAMKQALAICEQLGDRHRQSHSVNNLSIIFTEQGDCLSAQYYLQLGLELATATRNLTAQGEIYTNLGRNYFLLGKTDLAVESLEQGLRILESIGTRSLVATAMGHLANTKRAQGDPNLAESLYRQALEIAQQDDLRHTECDLLIGMAELLSQTNERQAREYSAKAVTLAKAIRNPDLLDRATALDHDLSLSTDVSE